MRKKRAPKRYIQPDPKFGEVLVSQFVNRLMWSGKKSTAYTVFYGALDLIEERTKESGLETWRKALQNDDYSPKHIFPRFWKLVIIRDYLWLFMIICATN